MNWVGLDNFRYLLDLPGFGQVVWNTVFISVMKIVAGLVVPVLVALLLNEVRRTGFKRTIQTIIYMPHFFSWVILASIIFDVLSPSSGIVNMALKAVGIDPIQFLASNEWFPYRRSCSMMISWIIVQVTWINGIWNESSDLKARKL